MQIPLFIQRKWNKGKGPLKLFWWRYNFPTQLNFGDEITPIIINKLWGYKCKWSDINECNLAGAGSILEKLIRDHKNNNIIKVWGSGFMHKGDFIKNCGGLDFYAVRGRLSSRRIKIGHKITIGDPGLLVNLVFKKTKKVRYKVGVVAHYIDSEHPILKKIKSNKDYLIIDPLQSPEKVIKDITSCRLILSSSLHGLIVSDSFGIPNYWMPLSDNVSGGGYKFYDYYTSIGRKPIKKPTSIINNQKALDKAVREYTKIENLKKIQKNIILSFPYNINLSLKKFFIFAIKPSVWKKIILN